MLLIDEQIVVLTYWSTAGQPLIMTIEITVQAKLAYFTGNYFTTPFHLGLSALVYCSSIINLIYLMKSLPRQRT